MVTKKDIEHFRHQAKLLHKNLLGQAEMGFGDQGKWPLLRGVIMDSFGTHGLDGLIQRLIEKMDGRHDEKQAPK